MMDEWDCKYISPNSQMRNIKQQLRPNECSHEADGVVVVEVQVVVVVETEWRLEMDHREIAVILMMTDPDNNRLLRLIMNGQSDDYIRMVVVVEVWKILVRHALCL